MIRLLKASDVYKIHSRKLYEFLLECGFLVDGAFSVPLRDINAVARENAKFIIDKCENRIIVNDVKWHHFMDDKLPWDSILNIFLDRLRKQDNYISKRFLEDFPDTIVNLDTDTTVSGELKEEIYKIISTRTT